LSKKCQPIPERFCKIFFPPPVESPIPDPVPPAALSTSTSIKTTTVKALTAARIGAINWLASQKITEGSGQGAIVGGKSKFTTTFRPQDAVNRGAMAQFMKRLVGIIQ
jgi:hypothetical protein